MRSFGDEIALNCLIDSHAITALSIRQNTASVAHWLESVPMHERARQALAVSRSVERTKATTIVLALRQYAAWEDWVSHQATAPEIDPDRYYQEVRDRRDRYEESCRYTQELYRSGDLTERGPEYV